MHATGLASTWLSCRDREKKKPLSVSHPTSRSSLMSSRIQRTRAQCVVLLSALSCEKSQKKMAIIGVIGRRIDRLIVHIRAYVRVCMFRKPVKPPATSSCTNDLLIAWYSSSNTYVVPFSSPPFLLPSGVRIIIMFENGLQHAMEFGSSSLLCSGAWLLGWQHNMAKSHLSEEHFQLLDGRTCCCRRFAWFNHFGNKKST